MPTNWNESKRFMSFHLLSSSRTARRSTQPGAAGWRCRARLRWNRMCARWRRSWPRSAPSNYSGGAAPPCAYEGRIVMALGALAYTPFDGFGDRTPRKRDWRADTTFSPSGTSHRIDAGLSMDVSLDTPDGLELVDAGVRR